MLDTVSDMLGMKSEGDLLLMSAVADGLPLTALDRMVHAIAPDDEQKFAHRIVSRPSLARRRRAFAMERPDGGRLSVEESTRLARLASVWALAVEVWGSNEAARRFLFAGHPLLAGRRPIDLVLESELGRPLVEGVLHSLQYSTAV